MPRLFEALQRADDAITSAVSVASDRISVAPERALESEFTNAMDETQNIERREPVEPDAVMPRNVGAKAKTRPAHAGDSTLTGVIGGSMPVCPYCAAPCDIRPSTWKRAWSRVRRQGEYRCTACERRFRTPRSRVDGAAAKEPPTIPGFVPSEDRRNFEELIRDLARDERELRNRPGNSSPRGDRQGRGPQARSRRTNSQADSHP